jgi:pimeloyl-ACP methyl ester carboxylesterase
MFMTRVTYTARGRGYEVRLTTEGTRELVVTSSGVVDPSPVVVGSDELTANAALVTRLAGYASNELAYRRLRSPEKRMSHRLTADRDERDAIAIAEMVIRTGSSTVSGWCSGCFEQATHARVKGDERPKRRFLCLNCGTPTTRCAVPGCAHLALVNPRALHTLRYCAAHRHEIPSFEKLTNRLANLADSEGWLEFESRNATRITKVAGGTVGAAIVIAPMAFFAAPVVGAALGGSALGGGLTGAAATSHGLAMLGGGAVATGGLGMAGGTAVVTATGAALGGALGASTVAAYAGADKSFRIELVRRGTGTPVVFATGFLTEGTSSWGAWRRLIDSRFSDSPVYQLRWGAKELEDLGVLVASGGAKIAVRKILVKQAKKGSKAFGSLPGIGAVFAASDIASNPWTVAKARAGMTGAALADLIARTDEGPYVLIGHSLGARVMVAAAQALGTRAAAPKIASMHLLGAAVGDRGDWRTVDDAVAGKVWNYYSSKDQVLRWLYSLAEGNQKAVGFVGFRSRFPCMMDRNVSRTVSSHSAYVGAVALQA